jgi:acyl carrier protein
MSELASQLRKYVDETFLFGVDTDYANDDSFMENGIIDSAGVLELIAHLEATYDIEVRDDDLVPENLDSIDGLTGFLDRKRERSTDDALRVVPYRGFSAEKKQEFANE